ncbi:sensor histidine kinase [Actinomadura viridis]|uniref:histidine kinase n=1 Tax=Actinomadura viridis TaxID=58110 RepID=A0A931DRZ6_9ACTN|nr:sensor histidine kinase [Actinomadura viridis]MBG6093688.1 sensor histidine kinase regulating citrate/malate metabolism [Actinomadura viridis]
MTGRGWSLARQLLVLQAVIVGILVVAGASLAYVDSRRAADDRARQTVTVVALSLADAPSVREALALRSPSDALQPYAERVRRDTGVDFITIMSPAGIRYTHPSPERIGEHFIGNTAPALAGRTFSETYTGTLGPSVRTVAPVFDGSGRVVALVAVGITIHAISAELRERLVPLAAVAAGVLAAGIGGSWLVSNRLRRQTRGVAPDELRRMFDYYEAILHAVREGLVLLDRDGRVVLCNDAARDLLDLESDPRGTAADGLGLPVELSATMNSAEPRSDEIHVGDTRVLVVNTAPVRSRNRAMGNVVTLRDHTELQALMGELDTVRGFAESLRSQAHEAANRLHTVVSLVELGRPAQAVEFATAELRTAQRLTDRVVGAVREPVLAALLLGKSTEAAERGVELVLDADMSMDGAEGAIEPRDLVTILGNLIDNAVDAAIEGAAGGRPRAIGNGALTPGETETETGETETGEVLEAVVPEGPPKVTVSARTEDGELVIEVSDTGPGLDGDVVREAFRRGWTTKAVEGPAGPRGLGLALVGQAVRRHHGEIEVGRDVGAVVRVRLPLRRRPVPEGDRS